jgi:LysR family transcriptional regulator, glycine cleavage system transcriptional activator
MELVGSVFEDFNLLRAAALSGQGVALCPQAMIRDDLDAGRLIQLSDIVVQEEFGYYLLTQSQADPITTPALQAFRTWALETRNPTPSSRQATSNAGKQSDAASVLSLI